MKKTKNEQVTDWIPADIKPTICGWYERQYGSSTLERLSDWWDGKHFCINGERGMRANRKLPWRGLASDPSKGA